MNISAQKLCSHFDIEYEIINDGSHLSNYEDIIVVDTHSYEQIPILKEFKVSLLIDHHQDSPSKIKAELYSKIDSSALANAQLILWLFGIESFKKHEIDLITIALISDTHMFESFDKKGANDLSNLLDKSKSSFMELKMHAFPREEVSERLSLLNAFKRVEFFNHNEYVIATSNVSSKAGEAATLITKAADIAFVAKQDDDVKLSIRSNDFFPIPLNEIAAVLAKKLGGAGGGHKRAAGAYLNAPLQKVLDTCVKTTQEMLDQLEK